MVLSQRSRTVWVSGLLHLLVLLPLALHHRGELVPVLRPGTAQGSRVTLTYSPGRPAAETALNRTHAAVRPATEQRVHTAALQQRAAVRPVTADDAAANGSGGGDSLGSGNVTVALPTYFPWPRPDLAGLPRGTRGDVIVDVTIDASGKIVDSRLTQGLGQTIDANVLATIQSWTFKPATKDGVAIASEQELLFHYERG